MTNTRTLYDPRRKNFGVPAGGESVYYRLPTYIQKCKHSRTKPGLCLWWGPGRRHRKENMKVEKGNTMATKKRMVVVTTDSTRRGVFFGELQSHKNDIVVLKNAQMAIYWSAATKGVLGLASIGPQVGSKISPIVPEIKLNGVTAIMDASQEAIDKWAKQMWD